MSGTGNETDTPYVAFLSYARSDEAAVRRFQRALEAFRMPGRLVGKTTKKGTVPERLLPIFRDRDELVADGNLSATLMRALERSQHMIVFCSPAAAQSRWVNEEIRQFRTLHPDRPILSVILSGNPATRTETDPENACFPPALIEVKGDNAHSEPLAADLRHGQDLPKLARLKIVAAIVGIPLSTLVRRDMVRVRQRGMIAFATGISIFAILTFGLVTAETERRRAEANRAEAEDLIEFMLSDFADQLQKVGQLYLLDSIGDRALAYYEAQGLDRLTDAQLDKLAEALTLLGSIDRQKGDYDQAENRLSRAIAITESRLAASTVPSGLIEGYIDRLTEMAYLYRVRSDYEGARSYIDKALGVTDQWIKTNPDNQQVRFQRALALRSSAGLERIAGPSAEKATQLSQEALAAFQSLLEEDPDNREYALQSYFQMAGLASAFERQGSLEEAISTHRESLKMLPQIALLFGQQGTHDEKFEELGLIVALGRCLRKVGRYDESLEAFASVPALSEDLLERDPENMGWRDLAVSALLANSRVALRAGREDIATPILGRLSQLRDPLPDDPQQTPVSDWVRNIAIDVALMELAQQTGRLRDAEDRAKGLMAVFDHPKLPAHYRAAAGYLRVRTLRVHALVLMSSPNGSREGEKAAAWTTFLETLR